MMLGNDALLYVCSMLPSSAVGEDGRRVVWETVL